MQSPTLQYTFFVALVLLVTLAFVGIIQDFLLPLFWAAILAIVFHPVYQWIQARLGQRASLAALLTLGVILLAVILPLGAVGVAVVREATALYKRLETGNLTAQESLQALTRLFSRVTQHLDWLGVDTLSLQQGLTETVVTVSRALGTQVLHIGQNTLRVLALSGVMLYLLFFFLRDGHQIVEAILQALPLGNRRERRLCASFVSVARATIKGTLLVALIQGLLGGLLFALLGIEAAALWGSLMAVLSLLPVGGSAFVWGPAAVILFATGHIVKALLLVGAGVLVIGLIDNLLRPILIGRDTRVPDYVILLATLGALTVCGISGFMIGPILAALFLVVWDMFAQEHREASPVEIPAAEDGR
jgi:predicted PurR-regulated permease PerM